MFPFFEVPRISWDTIITVLLINVVGAFLAKGIQMGYRRFQSYERTEEKPKIKKILEVYDEIQATRQRPNVPGAPAGPVTPAR